MKRRKELQIERMKMMRFSMDGIMGLGEWIKWSNYLINKYRKENKIYNTIKRLTKCQNQEHSQWREYKQHNKH